MKENQLTPSSEKTATDTSTPEGHRQRHVELHKAFDELFADFIRHSPDRTRFLDAPIRDLMEWSHKQTICPTEEPK